MHNTIGETANENVRSIESPPPKVRDNPSHAISDQGWAVGSISAGGPVVSRLTRRHFTIYNGLLNLQLCCNNAHTQKPRFSSSRPSVGEDLETLLPSNTGVNEQCLENEFQITQRPNFSKRPVRIKPVQPDRKSRHSLNIRFPPSTSRARPTSEGPRLESCGL